MTGISQAREIRLLQSVVTTNLATLGYSATPAIFIVSQDADGYTTLFVDYTSATYTTGDSAAFVRLVPAGDGYPQTMFTLSHAGNDPINGGVQALLVAEGPATATPTNAQAQFLQDLTFVLRGVLSMPVVAALTTNGSALPSINGINGAVADSIPTAQMNLAVAGRSYAGGV